MNIFRAFIIVGFLLMPAALFPFAVQARPAAAAQVLSGRVLYVFDGDTLELATGSRQRTRVRLYGIDAPETAKRGEPGQPGGGEARQALQSKVAGRQVTVEFMEMDQYGRAVGVARVAGRDINREMVSEGWAWAYRHYLQGPYVSDYIGAEKSARARRAGLWRLSIPQPPWEYRYRQQRRR